MEENIKFFIKNFYSTTIVFLELLFWLHYCVTRSYILLKDGDLPEYSFAELLQRETTPYNDRGETFFLSSLIRMLISEPLLS